MNTASAELPPRVQSWPRRKIYLFIALAAILHVALVFVFGTKMPVTPRAVGRVPQLRIANDRDELIALTDPTLFALPHANDFITAIWSRSPEVQTNSFRWQEPPGELAQPENLGAAFITFMQTNRFAESPLNFKPEPKLTEAPLEDTDILPQATTLKLSANLAQRRQINIIPLPSLPVNDVLEPGKVQVLVDAAGNVTSAVLLESSANPQADQNALQLATQLRFAPAARLTLGEITFRWHTVPANTP